ncbi:MAG: RNA polymerase sigma-54 factor [Hydrogenophaga sp.]|jgi:RNA polymerase sigma-54 factor
MVLACVLAASLDDDGYLRLPLDEVFEGMDLDPAPNEAERRIALRRVQALDPLGIGARGVQECLSLQLPALVCPVQRALATTIAGEHLSALAARDVARLRRLLDAPPPQIQAICDAIRRLDPRPGWRLGSQHVDYVVPDVIARKHGRHWSVSLNPAARPLPVDEVRDHSERRHFQHPRGLPSAPLASRPWVSNPVPPNVQRHPAPFVKS